MFNATALRTPGIDPDRFRELPKFWAGTSVTDIGTFKDINGNLADPTVVQYEYAQQGRPKTTLTYGSSPIIRAAVGLYSFTIDTTNMAGLIVCVWIGLGVVQVTDPFYFIVEALPI